MYLDNRSILARSVAEKSEKQTTSNVVKITTRYIKRPFVNGSTGAHRMYMQSVCMQKSKLHLSVKNKK